MGISHGVNFEVNARAHIPPECQTISPSRQATQVSVFAEAS